MLTPHINTNSDVLVELVLMSGEALHMQLIAKTFLNYSCDQIDVRNKYIYTVGIMSFECQ